MSTPLLYFGNIDYAALPIGTVLREDMVAALQCAMEYAVEAQMSLAPLSWFHGSRVTTAHAHRMLYISELCEDCAVANEIDDA